MLCLRSASVSICAICARICWRPLQSVLCALRRLCQSAPSAPESAGGLCALCVCALRPCQSAPSAPESAGGLCVRVNLRHLRQNLWRPLRPCQSAPSAPESAGGLCALCLSICAICARICWRLLCVSCVNLRHLCQNLLAASALCVNLRHLRQNLLAASASAFVSAAASFEAGTIHLTRQQLADRREKTTRAADAARRGSTHTKSNNLPASNPIISIGAHPYGHHLKPS